MITNKWSKIKQAFNQLTLREQILIAITSIILTYVLCVFLFWQPFMENIQSKQNALDDANKQLSELQNQLTILNNRYQVLKNEPLYQNYLAMQNRINDAKKKIEKINGKVISDKSAIIALETLLKKASDVQLVKLSNLPAQAINLKDLGSTYHKLLYLHEINVSFKTSYISTLNYLNRIAKLNLPVAWDNLDYKVDTYPVANVSINLYWISDNAEAFSHV